MKRHSQFSFGNVCFDFNFPCTYAPDRCFAPQLIQIEQDVKMCLEDVHVITLC